jgi:hypothetical protein
VPFGEYRHRLARVRAVLGIHVEHISLDWKDRSVRSDLREIDPDKALLWTPQVPYFVPCVPITRSMTPEQFFARWFGNSNCNFGLSPSSHFPIQSWIYRDGEFVVTPSEWAVIMAKIFDVASRFEKGTVWEHEICAGRDIYGDDVDDGDEDDEVWIRLLIERKASA